MKLSLPLPSGNQSSGNATSATTSSISATAIPTRAIPGSSSTNTNAQSTTIPQLKKTTSFLKAQQQQKLREQIQQLRNIRQMMFQTFEEYGQNNTSNNSSSSPPSSPLPMPDQENHSNLPPNASSDSSSPQTKPTNPALLLPPTDQEESIASTQVYDHLYRKLRATVQLLSESLEEQGNLKALLELSFNPSVYESALQSEILHLSQFIHPSPTTTTTNGTTSQHPPEGKLTISEELLQNIKFRSLLLEREQLMSKIVDTRTLLEDEKVKRIQQENELDVTKKLLETAQIEIETLQQSLDSIQDEYNSLLEQMNNTTGGGNILLQQPSPNYPSRNMRAPGTPPSGRNRSSSANGAVHRNNAPSSFSGVAFNSHPTASFASSFPIPAPIPASEFEEGEEADLLDELDNGYFGTSITEEGEVYEGEYDDVQVPESDDVLQEEEEEQQHENAEEIDGEGEEEENVSIENPLHYQQISPEKTSLPSTSRQSSQRSPSSPDVLLASDLASPNANSSHARSPFPAETATSNHDFSSQGKHPLSYIVLDVDLENNNKDQVIVTLDSDPMLLAYQFMEKNELSENYFLPLSDYIQETQNQLIMNWHAHGGHPESATENGKEQAEEEELTAEEEEWQQDNEQPELAATTFSNHSSNDEGDRVPVDHVSSQFALTDDDDGNLETFTSSQLDDLFQLSPEAKTSKQGKTTTIQSKTIAQVAIHAQRPLEPALADATLKSPTKRTTKVTSLLSFLQAKNQTLPIDSIEEELAKEKMKDAEVREKHEEDGDDDGDDVGGDLDELDAGEPDFEEELPISAVIHQTPHPAEQNHQGSSGGSSGGPHYRSPYEISREVSLPFSPHPSNDLQSKHVAKPFFPSKKQIPPEILYDTARSPLHPHLASTSEEDHYYPTAEMLQSADNHEIVLAAKRKFAEEEDGDENLVERENEETYLTDYNSDEHHNEEEEEEEDYLRELDQEEPEEDDDDQLYNNYDDHLSDEQDQQYDSDPEHHPLHPPLPNHHHQQQHPAHRGGPSQNRPLTIMSDISDNSESISTEKLLNLYTSTTPGLTIQNPNLLNKKHTQTSLQQLFSPMQSSSQGNKRTSFYQNGEEEEEQELTVTHHHQNEKFNSILQTLHQDMNRMEVFSPMEDGLLSPFPLDKSISNEQIGDIIEIALQIIERANELRDHDQLHYAVPLYNNALKLLELSEYYELDKLKDEIMSSLL